MAEKVLIRVNENANGTMTAPIVSLVDVRHPSLAFSLVYRSL